LREYNLDYKKPNEEIEMEAINPQILSQPVDGVNLKPGTLGDQIDPARPTLLVFLRHFG
jgi:hypothetical protein